MQIKSILRPYRDIIYAFYGFLYDFYRFARYAGYYGFVKDKEKRDYKAVKIYHRLEKSLSFRKRNAVSGRRAVKDLMDLLRRGDAGLGRGFQECVAINVLHKFADQSSLDLCKKEFPRQCNWVDPALGGVVEITYQDLSVGKLDSPEGFFYSRHSVRDFSSRSVPHHIIKRSVELSLKAPSVCNRQAWYVYHVDDRSLMNQILSFQNGNAGFGHEIPSLLIVASDIKAFDTAGERYQHWIDGGVFAASLVYALHSLGLGSCCLNWSKTPGDDLRLRKAVPIKPHHTIIMMLAVGYPNERIKVCGSPRRPLHYFYEYWGS